MKLTIRKAVASDLGRIDDISSRVHLTSYSSLIPPKRLRQFTANYASTEEAKKRRYEHLLRKLRDHRWHIWVAEIDGLIVGYTKEMRQNPTTILKKGLFVDPHYQGQGIGEALFKTSLGIAKPGDSFYLSVIENNERARRLYEKYGFMVIEGRTEEFYGAKLVVMRRTVH